MQHFKAEKNKELKDYLRDPCFHDATLKTIKYDYLSNYLEVEAVNPFLSCQLKFLFGGIETVFATKGNWLYGNSKEINSLTIEDSFSYLQKYIPQYDRTIDEFLYLSFQMFSEDEIHVVCKEVTVEKKYY